MFSALEQAKKAKIAEGFLRQASSEQKNKFLLLLADLLEENIPKILVENKNDLSDTVDFTPAIIRRLQLSEDSIKGIAEGVKSIAKAEDPVGKEAGSWVRPNGLKIIKTRVPIGVIACIFESRPNVIVDIAALCVKSGNAAILRGGKEAQHSNDFLMSIIKQTLVKTDFPEDAVQQLEDRRYEAVDDLIQLDEYLDLVIPRGRESLIKSISAKAKVPVIKHMRGLCHAYVDSEADVDKAIRIVVNAKTSNPATCNSIETTLVHQAVADQIMPRLIQELSDRNVEIRGCPRTQKYSSKVLPATEEDWSAEYLDLILAVKIVDSFEEAISHIQKYSSGLTDSIITENKTKQEKFIRAIDSATVLVNASNRFTDGGEFGLGAEIGISTSRIHMRGPMGLEDLTVCRYVVIGNGQVRE